MYCRTFSFANRSVKV